MNTGYPGQKSKAMSGVQLKAPIAQAIQRRLYSVKPQPNRDMMPQYQTQGMSPQNNKKF